MIRKSKSLNKSRAMIFMFFLCAAFSQFGALNAIAQNTKMSLLGKYAATKTESFKVAFTYSPRLPIEGQLVQFSGASTGSSVSFQWDFGDGTTSKEKNPTHIYSAAGFRKVALVAVSASSSKTAIRTITVISSSATATFVFSPATPGPGETVQFADTTSGTLTSWKWDFGDGGTSTVKNPSHTFAKEAAYTVTLIASGSSGSKQASKVVTVASMAVLTSAFTYAPALPQAGLAVQFTDLSTGTPAAWQWDFGDGAKSTSQNPSHIYTTAGPKTVTLVVTNNAGSTATTKTLNVVVALKAAFSYSPTSPAAGAIVQFTDMSTGAPRAWMWSFGDGATSTSQNPSHTYTTAGPKAVALTVTNSGGSNSTTSTLSIATVLTASFTYSPTSAIVDQTMHFTDTSVGNPSLWQWNFGDGTTSTAQNPSHTYTAAGSYNVSLTVMNASSQDGENMNIVVSSYSGGILNAASPRLADVQAAIDAAAIGDTVMIPAGSATWTSTLTYSKGIHLQGAGVGETVITHTDIGINVMGQEGVQWTISGLTMIAETTVNCIKAIGSCKNFRIYNCKFWGQQASGACPVLEFGDANDLAKHQYGLVDNCEIVNGRILVFAGLGEGSWKEPTHLGSEEAVYVEDCRFTYPSGILHNVIDANQGGRYVFRHNYVEDSFVMSHSLMNGQSTYFSRGTRITEVYENTFVATQPNYTRFAAIFLRSGTGVVFNNKIINMAVGNQYQLAVAIDNVRTYDSPPYVGKADGTNPIDGNQEANGYPALDQIGRGQDIGTIGDPLPRYYATNRTPQALEPMYIWNNELDGVVEEPLVHNGCEIHIKKNRDYYITPKPGYSPYPYPHPLRNQ